MPHMAPMVAEAGADVSDLLGEAAGQLVRERAAACICLQMHMNGVIDVQLGGSARKLLVSITPGYERAGSSWCTEMLRDVTGLPAAQSERSAWHATLALASGIAHRFNNLLVAITGNAGLLRSALAPDHPEQAAIVDMEQAAREMAEMTRYLLAFAGEGRYAPRPVSISRIVDRALACIDQGAWPDVRFLRNVEAEIPEVEADPAQIEQAVSNLLTNALESLPGGRGTITLATRASQSEATVVLSVSDNGEGMTEETRARIFEPFFTTKSSGRGLGLAAVIGIARGHRGSVRVRSEPGVGSTFELHLPRPESIAQQPRSSRREARDQEKGSVLVVDDDPGTLRVLQRMLGTQGFEVVTAHDGASAMKAAAQYRGKLSLCIADMVLPDTTGDRLCAQLKDLVPEMPVMVCSGYSDDLSARQAKEGGADGFLGKPFQAEELLESVRRLTNR